jgi:serine/threonine protein phosphatase PrpC
LERRQGQTNTPTTHRFVLGSDGLFDTLSNARIGQYAARSHVEEDTQIEYEIDVREAAVRIMTECLKSGGYVDDVTIIVMDVIV